MKILNISSIIFFLFLSACATQTISKFDYNLGAPDIKMTEFMSAEQMAEYQIIEEFSILTTPVVSRSLNKIAAKELIDIGKSKKADVILIKSKEVFPESSMLNLHLRQRITGLLLKKL